MLTIINHIYEQNNTELGTMTCHGNISVRRNFNTDTMLFVNNQILLAKYEDDLQWSAYNFNNIGAVFSMEINTKRTKIMAFRRDGTN
jgi:hypothetical protein